MKGKRGKEKATRSANESDRAHSRQKWPEEESKRTRSLSNIISNGNASQLLERSDVEMRLLPLGLGTEGVLERLGLDDVRSLETHERGTIKGGEGMRVSPEA